MGSQFTSALWAEIAQRLGVELHRTTAYHPQANGLVERFHRTMKTALRSRMTSDNWWDELPWIMLGVRTASKEDLNMSTAELVYGAPLTVPGEFLGTPTEPWSPRQSALQAHRHCRAFRHSANFTSLPAINSRSKGPRDCLGRQTQTGTFGFRQ